MQLHMLVGNHQFGKEENGFKEVDKPNFFGYGWQKYFKGGLKIIETDGDHMGMIRLPNIQDLAKKLNTLLK